MTSLVRCDLELAELFLYSENNFKMGVPMMGMDSNVMMGNGGGSMMFFGWLLYILIVVLIVLGIAALWKYLNK